MKKTITLLAMAASAVSTLAQAASISIQAPGATAVCAAAAAKPILGGTGAETSGSPITVTTSFVKVAFSITCSANTHAFVNNGYGNLATNFAVAGASTKGNQAFRGGANSGGIALSAGCAAGGCTSTDATVALALAVTNGS